MSGACASCLARSWLLARLAGHLDVARSHLGAVMALADDELIAAVGGSRAGAVTDELLAFDPAPARRAAQAAGLELVCRCQTDYPVALRALEAPPAVLHVAGPRRERAELAGAEAVAIVGARRASAYGRGIARELGAGVAASGIAVISGMALGIDGAAHAGAVEAGGPTVAVLPGGAERPHPAGQAALYRRILAAGLAVSELPPGTAPWRWCYPARNRLIAGLAALTIVVEAGRGSGALITARLARELGRPVAAVPGRVGTAQAEGPNALLVDGAAAVRGPQDVLDLLYGVGRRAAAPRARAALGPELERLRRAIAEGHDTPGSLVGAGFSAAGSLAALAELELGGHIRREPGGRFSVVP